MKTLNVILKSDAGSATNWPLRVRRAYNAIDTQYCPNANTNPDYPAILGLMSVRLCKKDGAGALRPEVPAGVSVWAGPKRGDTGVDPMPIMKESPRDKATPGPGRNLTATTAVAQDGRKKPVNLRNLLAPQTRYI
jgi:hypothetical protein